jgi:hypothetical protein
VGLKLNGRGQLLVYAGDVNLKVKKKSKSIPVPGCGGP